MTASKNKLPGRGLTRRRFLIGTVAVAGGGLALRWATHEPDSLRAADDILEPNAFLQITPDGRFIFQLDRVELGQGTMTGFVTLVAEELDVNPERFEVQFAPVLSTFQRPLQMTGQSRSMVDSWDVLRETGAAARAMLLAEAAERWQVSVSELTTHNGLVLHSASDRRMAYAELAEGAASRSVPGSPQLKDPADYRLIGKHVPRLDIPVKIKGEARYGIDVQLDGMLTAVVARCPELGANITGFDAAKANTMPGVRGIVQLNDSRGVAVVADDFWSAKQAAQSITIEWQPGPLAGKNDRDLLNEMRVLLDEGELAYEAGAGDVAELLADNPELHVAEYSTPYLAHAAMEPMNATAHVTADHCELWLPTQGPDMARQVASDLTGLQREQVEVHTTWIGGGFGRRVMWDFVVEAVEVAMTVDVPVKLVWTREDDIRCGYFRQQTLHRVTAATDIDGYPSAWLHRQVVTPTGELLTPPTISTLLPESVSSANRQKFGAWLGKKTVEWMGAFQAREGAIDIKYKLPNWKFAQTAYEPGVPISIWRSVGNSYNAFVVESYFDELAHKAAKDPLQYRRELLAEQPRHLAVLDQLERFSGWGEQPNQGLAIFDSFGAVVGQVATVSIDEHNNIRVEKVVCVVDCVLAVNPDIVRQQMEGAIIFGLTAALYGEINIENGRIKQSNFHDYRMLTLADAPDIEVHIIESGDTPSGIGEPGTPVIAPAVANAVFAATGKRLRALPLRL